MDLDSEPVRDATPGRTPDVTGLARTIARGNTVLVVGTGLAQIIGQIIRARRPRGDRRPHRVPYVARARERDA
jgi:hypothetical protein